MPTSQKVSTRDYYDVTPPVDNTAGDIWSSLPTYGYAGGKLSRGLIITPACDLSNRKVETATYLPIVTLRQYFLTPAFLPELQQALDGQLKAANLDGLLLARGRYSPPSVRELEAAREMIGSVLASTKRNDKEKSAAGRAQAAVSLLNEYHTRPERGASTALVRSLFGDKQFDALLRSLIGNSHKLDIHFLPSDEQPEEWSGVPQHSVVLFRYAFSASVDILDRAQDLQVRDWATVIDELSATIPAASAFAERPIKHSRLRPRFMSDLLTRYIAMYVRIGSPDFSAETVARFANTFMGEK